MSTVQPQNTTQDISREVLPLISQSTSGCSSVPLSRWIQQKRRGPTWLSACFLLRPLETITDSASLSSWEGRFNKSLHSLNWVLLTCTKGYFDFCQIWSQTYSLSKQLKSHLSGGKTSTISRHLTSSLRLYVKRYKTTPISP